MSAPDAEGHCACAWKRGLARNYGLAEVSIVGTDVGAAVEHTAVSMCGWDEAKERTKTHMVLFYIEGVFAHFHLM